jgi:hypothetical protein
MKIRLLKDEYIKSEMFFRDFADSKCCEEKNMTSVYVELNEIQPFPIYHNYKQEIKITQKMIEAFRVFKATYSNLEQDVLMNHTFWISLFACHYRDYLLNEYPSITSKESNFKQILLKSFDWENYIYKTMLLTQYLIDSAEPNKQEQYVRLFSENLDIFNYCLKYRLFRNDKFMVKFFDILDKNNLSKIMKKKLGGEFWSGRDERYGRRVILEMNKRYPVSMIHLYSEDDMEFEVLKMIDDLKKKDETA